MRRGGVTRALVVLTLLFVVAQSATLASIGIVESAACSEAANLISSAMSEEARRTSGFFLDGVEQFDLKAACFRSDVRSITGFQMLLGSIQRADDRECNFTKVDPTGRWMLAKLLCADNGSIDVATDPLDGETLLFLVKAKRR